MMAQSAGHPQMTPLNAHDAYRFRGFNADAYSIACHSSYRDDDVLADYDLLTGFFGDTINISFFLRGGAVQRNMIFRSHYDYCIARRFS
ncbi:MAG: hypothetical protein KC547_19940, partial [Anaerolineae bacterium]|nr:hypothetical protein [Anaerolineae bacterium]